MHSILVLIFVVTLTNGIPQGYNYQQPFGQAAFQGISTSSISNGGSGIGSISSFGRIQTAGPGIASGSGFVGQSRIQTQQGPPIVTKHFYIHSAPEETEDELRQQSINVGQPRKHYNVVFIKAPVLSPKSAALTLAQAQSEEKTIIYVLSKKTDAADIQAAIQAAPTQPPSKPEVFFIKYKTVEEAQHAQHQIQAQYDALGGTTHVSDEGIAPVSSVIGSLGSGSSQLVSSGNGNGISGPAYLPPHV